MCNESKQFPYDIEPLSAEVNKELLNFFHGERTGFVHVGPERYFFPQSYKKEAVNFYNFQTRPDDIWVVSFPRSGTTWTQELVWLVANNLDFETAAKKRLSERFPFFEFSLFMHPDLKSELLKENVNFPDKCEFIHQISKPGYEVLTAIPSTRRRFIKSHFPFSLLPPSIMEQKSKVIYVARNPMDVAVSFYHLNRLFRTQGYVGNFSHYWSYFQRGLNPWMPYFSHIKEALNHRHVENVLILQYEEMKKDLRGTIEKVAKFLDSRIDDEGMENLLNHLEFENFRQNESVNMQEMADAGVLNCGEEKFVRNGGCGVQKEYLDNPDLLEEALKWSEEYEGYFKIMNCR